MVIGGIAVIAHGVQRMTLDIDAVIRGDAVAVHAAIKVFRRHQIAPRIANAEAFAATNLVLLMRHRPTEVDLDLSLGWTAFEHEALAARAPTRFGKVSAPMASVDDRVVFKAIAGRPRDIDDAITLLALYPHIDMFPRTRARPHPGARCRGSRARARTRTDRRRGPRGAPPSLAAGTLADPAGAIDDKIANRRPPTKSRTAKRPGKKAASR
jgi:hypothetical protein